MVQRSFSNFTELYHCFCKVFQNSEISRLCSPLLLLFGPCLSFSSSISPHCVVWMRALVGHENKPTLFSSHWQVLSVVFTHYWSGQSQFQLQLLFSHWPAVIFSDYLWAQLWFLYSRSYNFLDFSAFSCTNPNTLSCDLTVFS